MVKICIVDACKSDYHPDCGISYHKFRDVYAEGPGRFTGGTVGFHLRPEAQPVFMRARPLAYALREPVERALDALVRDGVITLVTTSDWATPIVPVMKQDGTIRMPVKLYKIDVSPPARACMMACEIFKVPTEMVSINIMNQEHRTPQYLKLNPLHTVPVLEDGDLILHDSHAILMYLSDTYAENDSMYPKDIQQRALVNQKLFFNASVLFPRLRNIIYAAAKDGVRQITEKMEDEINEAYSFIEEFLNRTKYLSGENMTIADLAAYATISTLVYILPLDALNYPKSHQWIKEMEMKPICRRINAQGARDAGRWISSMLK